MTDLIHLFDPTDPTPLVTHADGTVCARDTANLGSGERQPGRCLDLNGTTQYATVMSSGLGTFDTPIWCVSAWFAPTTKDSYTMLWSYDYTSHASPYYSQTLRTDTSASDIRITAAWNNGSVYQTLVADITPFALNAWHHVVAMVTDGEQRLYVDGVLQNSSAVAGAVTYYDQEVWIGKSNYATSKAMKIAHVSFYDRFLSDAELAVLYKQGIRPERLWDGHPIPTGYWAMDDDSTTTILDASGNGYDGTITAGDAGMLHTGDDVPWSRQNHIGFTEA